MTNLCHNVSINYMGIIADNNSEQYETELKENEVYTTFKSHRPNSLYQYKMNNMTNFFSMTK